MTLVYIKKNLILIASIVGSLSVIGAGWYNVTSWLRTRDLRPSGGGGESRGTDRDRGEGREPLWGTAGAFAFGRTDHVRTPTFVSSSARASARSVRLGGATRQGGPSCRMVGSSFGANGFILGIRVVGIFR